MQFNPIESEILAPQKADVYKRYMEGKTFIGLNGGLSLPIADYSTNIKLGLGLGFQAKYFIFDHFVFGANFNFYSSDYKDAYLANLDTMFMVAAMNDTLKVVSIGGKSTLYPFTLNLEYYFSPKERFKPFLGLGLGFYVVNNNVEVTTNMEKTEYFREIESKYGSKITSNFGLCPYVGFMVDFNELMSMDFDVRYNQIFSSPALSSISVNLGLIFNLSYKY